MGKGKLFLPGCVYLAFSPEAKCAEEDTLELAPEDAVDDKVHCHHNLSLDYIYLKEEKKPILYDFILSKKGPNLRLIYY